jgi:hypothetical protein
MNRKVVVYSLMVLALVLAVVAPLASAQTPAPAVPDKPAVTQAVPSDINATEVKAGSDPALDKLAQTMADQIGNETGAEPTEVNIYTLGADADFKAIVAEYEAEMTKAGWAADQKLTQSDDKSSVAAWADNDNMFMIALVPASADTDNQAVLFTITLLTIPDFAGAKPVDDANKATYDAVAKELEDSFVKEYGATSAQVRIFTIPADTQFKDVTAFYESEMAKGGWQPKQSATQTDSTSSIAEWSEGNELFIVGMVPASAATNNEPLLMTFALELPASGSGTVEATPTAAQ